MSGGVDPGADHCHALLSIMTGALHPLGTDQASLARGICMATMHYRLNENFVASDVIRWYDKATMGETVVIALPAYPSVQLTRRPNECVYWCTAGSRGMTVSLEDARQRLGMFQTRWCVDL